MRNWFTSQTERIEQAVKAHANRTADAEYHRLMAEYYLTERDKVRIASSRDAYRYADLFFKYETHMGERSNAERLLRDAKAKLDALLKVAP